MSHYQYLEKHLPKFLEDTKVRGGWKGNCGLISAHGDKFYTYRQIMEENGIHFYHGVMIGMLTYCYPYEKESREIKQGYWKDDTTWIKAVWKDPKEWIIENYSRFKEFLPPILESDED